MSKNNKKKKNFWFGFRIYLAILVLFIIIFNIYVWNTMKKYEKAQSKYVVENLVKDLEKGNVGSLTSKTQTKFEKLDNIDDMFKSEISGKKLTYELDSESYDTLAPVFVIKADDKVVAKVTLKETRHYTKMAILAMSDWKVDKIEASLGEGSNNVKVTCPTDDKVFVNGIELTSEEITAGPKDMSGFTYVGEYVKTPQVVTYEVKGLYNKPELAVTDVNGNNVDLSGYTEYTDVVVNYIKSDIPKDIEDYVIMAAKDYSNFFSRDLAGCSESTACLQKYFPTNSYYIQMAEMYRTGDMWMFSKHNAPVFSNVKVSDYIVYSENCFSCTVSFDKSMYLTATGETRVDVNNQTYYYVKIDGNWLIADIQDNTK